MKVYGKALAVFLSLLIILSVIVVSPREVLAKGNDFLEMPDTSATADEAPEEIPDTPSTSDESTSDESKIRFEYMIKSGEVTITGMEGTADELVVPAFIDGRPVVKIAETAFYSQIYLTKATLPHTLKEIEEYAFAYCENLQKVNMAEGVEIIGESAFDGCVSLSEIRLPSTVTEIYGSAFLNCESLTEIEIPKKVKVIREDTFAGCTSIKEVVIPEGVTSVGISAFANCWDLEKITLPASLVKIGDSAFADCTSLKEITIPEKVEEIGKYAFDGCKNMRSLKLPEKLQVLSEGAFASCVLLEEFTVPAGITQLEKNVLYNCTALKTLRVSEGVTRIVKESLLGCTALETMYLPESLTKIDTRALYRCNALKDIYFAGSENDWNNISLGTNQPLINATVHFAKENEPTIPTTAPEIFREGNFEYTVENGEAVVTAYKGTDESVTVPRYLGGFPVFAIAENAFGNLDFVKEVTISENIEVIKSYAFSLCVNLETLNFPVSLKKIESFAFYSCDKIANITYEGTSGEYKSIEISVGNDSIKNIRRVRCNGDPPPPTYPKPTDPVKPPEPEYNRFYIYLPTPWEDSENFEGIGVCWEKGSETPESFWGHEAARTYTENVYCMDVPADVEEIVFNNFYSGAWYFPSRTYTIKTTGYTKGENDTYPMGLESFSGMIYVIHGEGEKVQMPYDQTEYVYHGEWYYYYGNGEYGITPEKGEEFYTASYRDEPVTPHFESGDVNRDGKLNIKDVTLIQKYLAKITDLSPAQQRLADYNGDSKINVRDATAIQKFLAKIY